MNKIRKTLIVAIVTVLMLASSINVFALTQQEIQSYLNTYGAGRITQDMYEITQTDLNNIQVNLPGVGNVYLKPSGVQAIETHLASMNQEDGEFSDIQDQISGMDDMFGDVTPDLDTAAGILAPLVPAIRLILGIMVTIVTVGMTILCAADILYIVFPVFRGKCEDMKQKGGMAVDKNRSAKSGQTKLKFISDEAEYAVNAAETLQTGKNPLVIYFGKRVVSYIVLAIVLFILLTGNITIITDLAIKAAEGVINLIQRIGQGQ